MLLFGIENVQGGLLVENGRSDVGECHSILILTSFILNGSRSRHEDVEWVKPGAEYRLCAMRNIGWRRTSRVPDSIRDLLLPYSYVGGMSMGRILHSHTYLFLFLESAANTTTIIPTKNPCRIHRGGLTSWQGPRRMAIILLFMTAKSPHVTTFANGRTIC